MESVPSVKTVFIVDGKFLWRGVEFEYMHARIMHMKGLKQTEDFEAAKQLLAACVRVNGEKLDPDDIDLFELKLSNKLVSLVLGNKDESSTV